MDPRVLTLVYTNQNAMIPYQTYRLIHPGLLAAYSRHSYSRDSKSVYVYNYFALEGSGIL